jgi:hypothetical protein
MPLETRQGFNKNDNTKEDVAAEGNRQVEDGIAESFTVEDGGTKWILVVVLKQIS